MARPKSEIVTQNIAKICEHPVDSMFLDGLEKIVTSLPKGELELTPDLTKTQKDLLSINQGDWNRYAYWIFYERFPIIDIGHKPYNRPDFATHRKKAKILYFEMELCKLCFEKYRQKLNYDNPFHWWFLLMLEHRQGEVDAIIKSSVCSREEVINTLKIYSNLLDRKKYSCNDQERFIANQPPHRKTLFLYCFKLLEVTNTDRETFGSYWNLYISLHKDLLEYWQQHPNLGVFSSRDDQVYFSQTRKVKLLRESR